MSELRLLTPSELFKKSQTFLHGKKRRGSIFWTSYPKKLTDDDYYKYILFIEFGVVLNEIQANLTLPKLDIFSH